MTDSTVIARVISCEVELLILDMEGDMITGFWVMFGGVMCSFFINCDIRRRVPKRSVS